MKEDDDCWSQRQQQGDEYLQRSSKPPSKLVTVTHHAAIRS